MTSSSPIDVYEKKLKIAIHAQLIKNTSRVDHRKQLLVQDKITAEQHTPCLSKG